MITAAHDIKTLVRGTSYKSLWVNKSLLLKNPDGSPSSSTNNAADAESGNGVWSMRPIFRFLVAKNTVSSLFVRLWLTDCRNDAFTDVPIEAFKTGNEYSMYLDKYEIVDNGGTIQTGQDANFVLVGYVSKTMPMDY